MCSTVFKEFISTFCDIFVIDRNFLKYAKYYLIVQSYLSAMSAQLKAAIRSFSRSGKSPIPRIVNIHSGDIPFEHFQHFVVAPAVNKLAQQNNFRPRKSQTKLAPLGNFESSSDLRSNKTSQVYSTTSSINTNETSLYQSLLFSYDHKIEKYLAEAAETSYWEAAEKIFLKQLNANEVTYWVNIPSIGVLYSSTKAVYLDYNSGIISSVFKTKSILITNEPIDLPEYDNNVDGKLISENCPFLAFPFLDDRNQAVGVLVCTRSPGNEEFTDDDEQFVEFFQHKFKVFSRWLLNQPVQEPMILDILQIHRIESLIPTLISRMQIFFSCRKSEIWSYDQHKKKLILYEEEDTKEVPINDAGIVSYSIENEVIVNTFSTIAHPAYSAETDGPIDEAIIVVPVVESSNRYVYLAVLRGPISRPIFTSDDEDVLRKMAPFIALALSNAYEFSKIQLEYEKSAQEKEGLAALLEVAEILSGQLDTERLCEIIMEKGRYLTKADRCSLFLVSQTRDHLITTFHRGLNKCIDIPITKGVVGRTVTEAKVLNITDAYEDPNFDNSTDIQTGYRTKSILSVPIFNQRGEVMGVTEMINKGNGMPFSKWDTSLIQIFNVFCGISLENARLYKESKDMSSHLRSFFGISLSFSKSEDTKHIMTDILRNARRALDSRRGSIFIAEENADVFETYIVDGGKMPATLPIDKGIIGSCFKNKEPIICNDAYGDPRFNKSIDKSTGFKTISLLAVPIINHNGKIFGVIEIVNRIHGGYREKDLKLLNSIATFVAVAYEESKLRNIAAYGNIEAEIPEYLNETEKKSISIPTKLKLTEEECSKCLTLDFFAISWDGINLIKLLFYLFNRFDILRTFKIPNEVFFRFLYTIRNTYNPVPYHNWIHACDVTQYTAYELQTSHLDRIYTNLELFALLISAVCHDANHDGFNNIYNLKVETPLGILFKDQSVMETHHCSVSIGILTKEECNLFASLSPSDYKLMWSWMITLILATDMAHHFKLVKSAAELLDNKTFSLENADHRILSMQLLLKTADISNVSRPFPLADKWCDVLCEEFFRQGDNEKKMGIGLTSPLNDRENPDKPKSQIGFYNFICIPLYQAVSRIFPELEVNLNSVKSNLEVWKAMVSQSETVPETNS
ncbi:3'5'-cyclic nucleotide phosphodiesterase family protein [Tritrichomonas foetus]|uniref:3'5'-cyclic nucleotide phosphodiesterase family protein n=1 Tax=Tritrichomonas foetus TaxID=1144522 RepID=A0A1J4KHG8_9EUKA|nr:3'5'-cyclic nucleotide phosphodiesterase family protein [Tritrichomonas foetus]|eukprot:OHT10855.1 3'5'-cyclic nucleotide phosphodiesterase family protein [Tritrichomonas foetus]